MKNLIFRRCLFVPAAAAITLLSFSCGLIAADEKKSEKPSAKEIFEEQVEFFNQMLEMTTEDGKPWVSSGPKRYLKRYLSKAEQYIEQGLYGSAKSREESLTEPYKPTGDQ